MNYSIFFWLVFFYFTPLLFSENKEIQELFDHSSDQTWKQVFIQENKTPWQENWFLDGQDAKVTSQSEYFEINTQNTDDKNRIFGVLWTKNSFKGDLKIEYDFKKADNYNKGVNIIYIQATGDGQKKHQTDIQLWADQRKTAAMSNYFQNMHTYHMSYAAYGNNPNIDYKDYIRGRRYLPLANKGLKNTKLNGEYNDTGLFEDQQWVRVTIIKTDKEFLVKFKHPNKTQYCRFMNDDKPAILEGRVGLRLMPNRVSHFKNFSISVTE